jgi:glutathione S-transferase
VRTYGLDVGPAGQAWVDHMLAHPAMRAWEAAALAETWREDSHEAEIGAAGRIIEDYRAV